MANNRLLVLDDEIAIAELIERDAVDCGYETRIAVGAAAFWSHYESFAPTLIVADLTVPGVRDDGIVHALADHGCTARVMMTSGTDTHAMVLVEQIGRARGLTMVESMAKPFKPGALRERLAELARTGGK
jgi:DNA-binding response OmpR family regulator